MRNIEFYTEKNDRRPMLVKYWFDFKKKIHRLTED